MNNQIPNSDIQENRNFDSFPENNNRIINIRFDSSNGSKNIIADPVNIKVKDLLLAYAKKIGIDPKDLREKLGFIFKDCKININEEKDLISYGLENNNKIDVYDMDNVIGWNSNF